MVVDEKALARRMRQKYKGSGYWVAARSDCLIVSDGEFVAEISARQMPRKALGLIAEHVGKIPTDGEAFYIRKGQCQTEIAAASGAFAAIDRLERELESEESRHYAKRTRLTVNGNRVWQRDDNLEIVMIDPELEDMAIPMDKMENTAIRIGDGLYYEDDLSRLYINRTAMKEAAEQVKHLEMMQWA